MGESGPLLEAIISRTIGGRSEIRYRDLRRAPVPAGIKGYLAAAQTQAMNGMPGGQIDDPGTTGVLVRRALLASLVAEKTYQREEFIGELRKAVRFLSGYLVTPQRSLLEAVFGNSTEVPVATLHRVLSFATEYQYLPDLLTAWIRRKGSPKVGREEVRRVLRAIDLRVAAKHSEKELVELARPLFEFASLGEQGRVLRAPAHDLSLFYTEKGVDSFWQKVSSAVGQNHRLIEFDSLKNPPPARPPSIRPEAEGAPTADPEPVGIPESPEHEPDDHGPREESEMRAEAVGSAVPSLPDLSHLISAEQESLFVKRLFEHDSAFYTAILSSLNEIATWKEAALYLSQFYQTNDLDPFADDVVEFTDAVHRRYLHEGVS